MNARDILSAGFGPTRSWVKTYRDHQIYRLGKGAFWYEVYAPGDKHSGTFSSQSEAERAIEALTSAAILPTKSLTGVPPRGIEA